MVSLPALSILKCLRGWNTLCPNLANPCAPLWMQWRFGGRNIKNQWDEKQQACRIAPTGLPLFGNIVSHSCVRFSFPYSGFLACRFKICCVVHSFQPLVGGFVPRNFCRQMREPAIRRSAMPVLDAHRNIYHIAGAQLLCRFAPFLIAARTGNADEDLSSAALA